MLYYEAIIDYVKRCPGPHFRELTRELGIPVGTLQYWLNKLLEAGEIYLLRLAQRPRYFHRNLPEEEARAIYVVREARLSPASILRLAADVRPEVLRAVVEAYPCVRRDLVDAFITLFTQL
jgi:DNA-binding Lrp family transcriptional regulator